MEAVELILYELRPKWCKIAEVIWKDCGGYMVTRAKMPFLGRTLCRGPTKTLQNRTNVQVKGGGGQRPFEQCSKKLHFFERVASLKAKSEKIRALRETFERKDSICI